MSQVTHITDGSRALKVIEGALPDGAGHAHTVFFADIGCGPDEKGHAVFHALAPERAQELLAVYRGESPTSDGEILAPEEKTSSRAGSSDLPLLVTYDGEEKTGELQVPNGGMSPLAQECGERSR